MKKTIFVLLNLFFVLPAMSNSDNSWHYYVLEKDGKIASMAGPFSTLSACKESLAGNQGGISRRGLRTTACMQKAN